MRTLTSLGSVYQSLTNSPQLFWSIAILLLGIPQGNYTPIRHHKYGEKLWTVVFLHPASIPILLAAATWLCSEELCPLSVLVLLIEMTPPLTCKKRVWSRLSQSQHDIFLTMATGAGRSEKSQGSKSDPIRANPESFAWGLRKATYSLFPHGFSQKGQNLGAAGGPHCHAKLAWGPNTEEALTDRWQETDSLMTPFKRLDPAVPEPGIDLCLCTLP